METDAARAHRCGCGNRGGVAKIARAIALELGLPLTAGWVKARLGGISKRASSDIFSVPDATEAKMSI